MNWNELQDAIKALPKIVEKNQSKNNTQSARAIAGEERVFVEVWVKNVGWRMIEVDKLFYDTKTDSVVIRSVQPDA